MAAFVGEWTRLERPHFVGEDPQAPAMHSAAELDDQVHVAEYEHDQFDEALGGCTAWLKDDAKGFNDFSSRVAAHENALPPLIAEARHIIEGSPGMRDVATELATASYAKIAAWRKGLLALLIEWSRNPHGCALPTFGETPQPTAPDPGLKFYKATEPVAKAVDSTVDAAKRAADEARRIAESRWPYVLLGVAGAVAVVVFLRK